MIKQPKLSKIEKKFIKNPESFYLENRNKAYQIKSNIKGKLNNSLKLIREILKSKSAPRFKIIEKLSENGLEIMHELEIVKEINIADQIYKTYPVFTGSKKLKRRY